MYFDFIKKTASTVFVKAVFIDCFLSKRALKFFVLICFMSQGKQPLRMYSALRLL